MFETIKLWAKSLKRDVVALWIAARDPRTPWLAKGIAAFVAAYALSSPIDLIPDFIPVLGYLDDLLVVPLGIAVALRLIPPALMIEFRREAGIRSICPRSVVPAGFVIGVWLAAALAFGYWFWLHVR